MNVLSYNIRKITVLWWALGIPLFLSGQSESGDSILNNFVPEDSVISANIHKTPELQSENIPVNASPALPKIPMHIPGIKLPDVKLPPRYWGYEDAKNMLRYRTPEFDPWKPNLNLNFPPRKSILDLISENPLRALIYGVATLAGMANNTVVGEDKMNLIRLNGMVQSRSGIPETAISGNGTYIYEIDINSKHK
jgi:hypothetical protein